MDLTVGEATTGGRRVFSGIVRDVTDRMAADERRRCVLNTAVDAILAIDERGMLEGVNAATCLDVRVLGR